MIYLDHNATTPVYPEAAAACMHALTSLHGNPSSVHQLGQAARNAIDEARRQVGMLINVSPRELFFTSGATEANLMAIVGFLDVKRAEGSERPLLITSSAEHPSVIGAAAVVSERGDLWESIPLDSKGRIDLQKLEAALIGAKGRPTLVSVMLVQNELGNIYPVRKIADLAHKYGATMHCDATQAVGRMPVDTKALDVDLLSLSGHKFGAPKGIGALWRRGRLPLAQLLRGGHQERGQRAGTENVPGIIGLGAAAKFAMSEGLVQWSKAQDLGRHLGATLIQGVSNAHWLGDRDANIGNTCCIAFEGVPADAMLIALDLAGVAVSAGSACSSGSLEPSPVLLAAGVPKEIAACAIRFSTGYTTSAAEIDQVLALVAAQVRRIRSSKAAHAGLSLF